MASTICSSSSWFSWKNRRQQGLYNHNQNTQSFIVHASLSSESETSSFEGDVSEKFASGLVKRRTVVVLPLVSTMTVLGFPGQGLGVVKQGLLAGRVPGLSEPDQQGWRTYRRPDDKSGGHGVGWSPIIPYLFKVPSEWDEVPVSIADLGGTEIDLRFANPKQGRVSVVVAPVLRFSDKLGDNVTIEDVGPPEKVISAFGPEVIGENVDGKVLRTEVAEHSGRKYYQFELEPPHVLITATAAGNRLYLFNVTGNGLQWKRHYSDLRKIAESFRVVVDLLFGFDLLKFVNGTHPSPDATITSDHQTKPNPKYDSWKRYANYSRAHLLQLKNQFDNIVKFNRPISEYIQDITSYVTEHALLGKTLDIEDVVDKVLRGLDLNTYRPIIEAVRPRDTPIYYP
ncbi:hypothetical protein KSS87_009067 [Heliosperma pusillum]|nr:hypothetical protein KSS87_009067 [Heliosperma pusillum]